MSETTKRSIEIPNAEVLVFAYRENKDVLKENAVPVKVAIDLSKLTADDLLEWAYSAMVVSFQSKLRSKNPAKAEEDGSYKWTVPSRGTRTIADPAKLEEKADKAVKAMSSEAKYNFLIKQGVPADMATTISGYTVPKK